MNAKLLARQAAPAALLLAVILSLAAISPPPGRAADRPLAGLQETLTLYADADATTKSWEPNANFGADTMLQVHYDNVEGTLHDTGGQALDRR